MENFIFCAVLPYVHGTGDCGSLHPLPKNVIASYSSGEIVPRILVCFVMRGPTYQLLQIFKTKFKNMLSTKLVQLRTNIPFK